MTAISTNAAGLTLALHSRSAQATDSLRWLDSAQAAPSSEAEASAQDEYEKAREAANKFEALLIHNMLKGMRKTTMSEDRSNDRAIYDDMFDENIANTMMEAGGIGVADQILSQIRQQQGKAIEQPEPGNDAQRLLELAKHIERPASASAAIGTEITAIERRAANTAAKDGLRLSMVSSLWGEQNGGVHNETMLTQAQKDFVMPLAPHAQRNAQKLGTSPQAIIAIAALETGWGGSLITDKSGNDSHNLFGIKASASDQQYATIVTTEYIEGSPQKLQARFKAFDSTADAVDGFADFIMSNPRYTQALQNAADPEQFLTELQKAGYATDPNYADKAISIMRQITGNPLPL